AGGEGGGMGPARRSSPAPAGTGGGPASLFAGPASAMAARPAAAVLPYWAPRAPVDAAWTVGKVARWRWSPVISSTWATCGETAAKRRKPPSSPARRAVLTSTASPVASQKLTLDRSITSRLEPGRRKLSSCLRSAGALAMSSSPASSAMVMPPSLRAERSRPRWTVVAEFMTGLRSRLRQNRLPDGFRTRRRWTFGETAAVHARDYHGF